MKEISKMVKYRQGRKKNTSESSTQTSPLMSFMDPIVLVDRLNIDYPKVHKPVPASEPPELSIKNPPQITANSKPSSISRAPNNYTNFVKPITNNEKVNSTLDYLSDTDEYRRRYCTRRSNGLKKVSFIRPGPMCYKRRVLQILDDDMNVPIMLSDPVESACSMHDKLAVVPPLANVNLDTILESTNENSIPELEMNFDFENLDVMESNNIETQTEARDISIPQVTENFKAPEPENIEDKSSEQPQRISINYKGITTVISRTSTQDMSDSVSPDSSNTSLLDSSAVGDAGPTGVEDNKFDQQQRFLKIKAHTVHIHNHFYKQ